MQCCSTFVPSIVTCVNTISESFAENILPSVCKLYYQNKLCHYYYGTALLGGWRSDGIKEIKIGNNFVRKN